MQTAPDLKGTAISGYRSAPKLREKHEREAIRCTSAALLCAGDSAVEELEMDGRDQKRRLDEYSEI